MSVNNGKRVTVALGDFAGLAGFVQRTNLSADLAYVPNARGSAPGAGAIIDIEGVSWRVLTREASPYVDRMIVLSIEPVPA